MQAFILDEREKYWIEKYDSYNNGYNSTLGGNNGIAGHNKLAVEAYDMQGNYIKTYESIASAARELQCSPMLIVSVLKQRRRTAKGYQFKYKDSDTEILPIINYRGGKKPVLQLDDNNNIINEYASAIEASEKTGAYAPSIKRVCQGKKITTHGYRWQYKENYKENNS